MKNLCDNLRTLMRVMILTHDEIYFLRFDDEMEVSFFSQVTLYSFELGKVQFHSVMVLEL